MIKTYEIKLSPYKRGFHLITNKILEVVEPLPDTGLLNIFLRHTSAAITINENYDPDVRRDMEVISNELVPEDLPFITHDFEGLDDMPAHFKSSMFGVSLTIPIIKGELALGTWQGIYLCE
ncbi:MAG TPA: secondary thiamine-phosphate synthase enzyme YjbQ, partial [Bacteroidales bacterium]|nr:secondary thiamine-phosphate synthase enzyme YjbQ [Bacteroidales bacterium]